MEGDKLKGDPLSLEESRQGIPLKFITITLCSCQREYLITGLFCEIVCRVKWSDGDSDISESQFVRVRENT